MEESNSDIVYRYRRKLFSNEEQLEKFNSDYLSKDNSSMVKNIIDIVKTQLSELKTNSKK